MRELCSLTPNQKRLLHLTNGQLQISEAIFEACSALIDDTDPRLLVERIEDLSKLLPSFEFHEK